MTEIDIPTGEQGTTRLFSLSMTASEAQALRDDTDRQKAVLGLSELNSTGIEVFEVSDLGDLGLAGYLRDGVDAREEDLRRDRTRLAAIEGWVMVVSSLALPDTGATLNTAPELTLIGTYRQTAPDTAPIALEAAAAMPYTGTADPLPPMATNGRSGSAVVIAILALIALGFLWWATR